MKQHSPLKTTLKASFLAITLGLSSVAYSATTTELNVQAKQYYKNKDYANALKIYQQSAEQGDAKAMSWMGYFYEHGKGVSKDMTKAIDWYTKSANAGYAWSMDKMGDIYRKGKSVTKDETIASKWYQQAAEKGQADSMSWLYTFYRDGRGGLPKNEAKALEWLKKSANAGDDWAMKVLADRYRKGQGVIQNYSTALGWYEKAADKGSSDAMNNIGWMYKKGQGVTQNYSTALGWFKKAADKGNSVAMQNLGYMHNHEQGVTQSYEKGLEWYKKAADKRNSVSMYNLGVMYRDGKGVIVNFVEARKWFEKSAEKNHGSAYSALGKLYANGEGVPKDKNKAKEMYQKSIKSGNTYGYVALGELYSDEFNDDYKAFENYKIAAEKGLDVGMTLLAYAYAEGNGVSRDYNQAAYWYSKALKANDKFSGSVSKEEDTEQFTRRKLENLLNSNKITDPTIRKQVESIFTKSPLITWQSTPPTTTDKETITFSVTLTDQGGGIGNVRVLLDGVPVDQATSRGINRQINQNSKSFNLIIPEGRHEIIVDAMPAENIGIPNKVSTTITSTYKKVEKPKLHAVVVGINDYENDSLSLKYATSDADAVYKQLQQQVGGLYDQGSMTLLTSRQQTSKQSIIAKLKQLKQNTKMGDVFVFYVAAHGTNYANAGYYMYTSDVKLTSHRKVTETGIGTDELEDLLAEVPTNKKLVIMDTCNSGNSINADNILARGNDQDMIERMNRKSGVTVLMASSDQQSALEGYQGHGLFTYGVLQALGGKADNNNNGYVKTLEMASYLEDEIPTLSKQVFNHQQLPKVSMKGDGFEFKVVQ